MIESTLFPIVSKINEYLSSYILIFLLVGVGLWYSIRTRFVQVRCFGEGMKKFFGELNLRGGAQKSGMTSFQALATAIAAQVGTGNIVGASGAILTGGPGAIFWMWIIAFFGMATIYAEATLAQKTRIVEPGRQHQGRPGVLHHHRVQGRLRQVPGGLLRRGHHSGAGLHGLHGAVQLHRLHHSRPPSASPPGSWASCWWSSAPSSSWAVCSAWPAVTEKIVPIMAGYLPAGRPGDSDLPVSSTFPPPLP